MDKGILDLSNQMKYFFFLMTRSMNEKHDNNPKHENNPKHVKITCSYAVIIIIKIIIMYLQEIAECLQKRSFYLNVNVVATREGLF